MCKTQRLALAAARIKNNSKLQSKGKAEGGGRRMKPPPWGNWSGNGDGKNQCHPGKGVLLILSIPNLNAQQTLMIHLTSMNVQ